MKPSSRYFAKALPDGKGRYWGQFSGPGLVPEKVGPAQRPDVFQTEDEAKLAAYEALEAVLNARLQLRMKFEKVKTLTPEELSALMDALDITPTELGHILQSERIIPWLDGVHIIPHHVRLLLGLFEADPQNIDRAEAITQAALERNDK